MKIPGKITVPQEITEFYKALGEICAKHTAECEPVTVTEEQKQLALEQKVPLLNFVGLKPDRDTVNAIFEEVYNVILAHRPQLKDELEKIKAELDVQNKDLRPLLEQFIWQDENSLNEYLEKNELNGELLSLILFNVAKPLVAGFVSGLKDPKSHDKWYKNTCPVCGWKASIAVTSGENRQRNLHCSLCETAWPFKNMECPHCSNEDHNTLKYLTIDDDEVYRINVCDKCKGYIKTLDEGKVAVRKTAMEEDLKTLHLDIIAEREGYLKDASTVPDKDLN